MHLAATNSSCPTQSQEKNRKGCSENLHCQIDFGRLFDAAPVAMCITSLNGRFIEANEEFVAKSGYSHDELVGSKSVDLGIWQDYNDRHRILGRLTDEGTVKNEDIYFRNKSGASFAGLFSAELIEVKGEPCVFAFITDITERKRLEEQIETLNTELMARKMELEAANQELEAFNYTVSHDLNGPLTIIGGFCQLLKDQCRSVLEPEQVDYLRRIQDGTRVMERLIESLLAFSRLSRCELRKEQVDLTHMATGICCNLQAKSPERRASITIADGMTVNGDGRFLQIALENLLGNAWKYSGKKKETFIEFGTEEARGKNCYFIRDKGAGFDNKFANTIFSPFKRLHSDKEFTGHGIGLATVHRIIQRHGGTIWAEGTVGEGATFYFTL